MPRSTALRRSLVPLALAALLLAGSPPVRAAGTPTVTEAASPQPDGAWLVAGCGLLVRAVTICPHPVGISVTVIVCALMVIDALAAPEH